MLSFLSLVSYKPKTTQTHNTLHHHGCNNSRLVVVVTSSKLIVVVAVIVSVGLTELLTAMAASATCTASEILHVYCAPE